MHVCLSVFVCLCLCARVRLRLCVRLWAFVFVGLCLRGCVLRICEYVCVSMWLGVCISA